MSLPADFETQRKEAERRVREMNRQYNEKINKYSASFAENKGVTASSNENNLPLSLIKDSDTLLVLILLLLLADNRKNLSLTLALLYIIL